MVYNLTRIRGRRNKTSNHIKHGTHLKVIQTLKEIKKSGYDWSNIEKDIREFYFKCSTCEIRTFKPRNYVVKHIESDYFRRRYQADTVYLTDYTSNDSRY